MGRDMELEVRKRNSSSRGSSRPRRPGSSGRCERSAPSLIEDAHGDMVKCLNCNGVISFDSDRGNQRAAGTHGERAPWATCRHFVRGGCAISTCRKSRGQENERANRH